MKKSRMELTNTTGTEMERGRGEEGGREGGREGEREEERASMIGRSQTHDPYTLPCEPLQYCIVLHSFSTETDEHELSTSVGWIFHVPSPDW